VLVDGNAQGAAPVEPVVLAPGAHEIVSRQGALVETQTVVAKAGDVLEAHFQRVSDAPVATVPASLPAMTEERRDGTASRAKWMTVIGLGSGAVIALGVGIGFAVASDNSANQARAISAQLNGSNACNAPRPPQCAQLEQAFQATNDQHQLAVGFEVAAGVLGATMVATWFLWRPAQQHAGAVQVRPGLNARGAGLTVLGEW
jgi:hypothetical protein